MQRGRGFTLIELLVVIAIIAILAAILFPIFAGAKRRAAMAACQSNMKQLGSAAQLYADDNNGHFPLVRRGQWGQFQDMKDGSFWGYAIRKYCSKTRHIVYCPSTPPVFLHGEGGSAQGVTNDERYDYYWFCTIGMNIAFWGVATPEIWSNPQARANQWGYGKGVRPEQIQAPSQTILFADSSLANYTYQHWFGWDSKYRGKSMSSFGQYFVCPGKSSDDPQEAQLAKLPGMYLSGDYIKYSFFDSERHGGMVNVLCADGHLAVKSKEWLLRPHTTNPLDKDYTWWDLHSSVNTPANIAEFK